LRLTALAPTWARIAAAIATASTAVATVTVATRARATVAAAFARGLEASLRALALFALGEGKELAAREAQLAVALDRDELHLDFVAFLHHVFDVLDARVRHLAHVEETVGAR
jgi:hypothetical protein